MNTNSQTADSKWKGLYLAGAVAPLVALAFYLAEMFTIIFGRVPVVYKK